MNTVLSNTRNTNMYIVVALAITLVVLLTFAVAPSITAPRPAVIPVTGSQNPYVQFLSGEKVIYADPAGLSEAISAYHAGEKAAYTSAVDASGALSTYRLGEKALYNSPDATDALSTWRIGEKTIAQSNGLEAALSTWRQGEKELK